MFVPFKPFQPSIMRLIWSLLAQITKEIKCCDYGSGLFMAESSVLFLLKAKGVLTLNFFPLNRTQNAVLVTCLNNPLATQHKLGYALLLSCHPLWLRQVQPLSRDVSLAVSPV